MFRFDGKGAERNRKIAVILMAVLVGLMLTTLGGCERMASGEFRVVGNNVNISDPIVMYIAGQSQKETLALGSPVEYIVEIPVPRIYDDNNATGPNYARQCFPVSGSVRGKNLASQSESICAREDQIIQADFELKQGKLTLSVRVR